MKNAQSSTGEKLTGDQCQERFDGGKSVSKGPIFVQRGVVSSKKRWQYYCYWMLDLTQILCSMMFVWSLPALLNGSTPRVAAMPPATQARPVASGTHPSTALATATSQSTGGKLIQTARHHLRPSTYQIPKRCTVCPTFLGPRKEKREQFVLLLTQPNLPAAVPLKLSNRMSPWCIVGRNAVSTK